MRSPIIRSMLVVLSLAAVLVFAAQAQAAQDAYQNPYGQQQLPTPSSPYPDMNSQSPYGGTQQPGYQPQQPGYQPQQPGYPRQQQGYQPQQPGQPQAPSSGPAQPLTDVLGQFKLSMSQDVMPMAATYSFGMPSLGVQVNIMSLAQPQALAMQQQQFLAMLPQMGGRISEQRQINLNGRPAELVAVTMQNPQANQQFVAYNVFITSASVWVQVMGPAQAQAQVQQAVQMILQGLQTR